MDTAEVSSQSSRPIHKPYRYLVIPKLAEVISGFMIFVKPAYHE